MKHFLFAAAFGAALTLPIPTLAQVLLDPAFRAVELSPVTHSDASLTIIDTSGAEHVYGPADLETLPTYALMTTTPWRQEPAVFEGVMLVELLVRHGLDQIDSISVLAENDYVSEIERAAWETGAIMIATRVDGRPLSRRERGPIQFVVPIQTFEDTEAITTQHLVWMAARVWPTD